MKNLIIIAAGIILVVMFASALAKDANTEENETGIHFTKGSWAQAQELALKENKPVFLDLSTSWCHYCKKMRANVYSNQEVGEYYNTNFINVSLDAEKGEGIELAKKYGVRGYPTFVYLNPDGSIIKQTAGYHNPEKFLELAKSLN
jgi:thioredoxin-related protein